MKRCPGLRGECLYADGHIGGCVPKWGAPSIANGRATSPAMARRIAEGRVRANHSVFGAVEASVWDMRPGGTDWYHQYVNVKLGGPSDPGGGACGYCLRPGDDPLHDPSMARLWPAGRRS